MGTAGAATRRVLLDTNALMTAVRLNLDLAAELRRAAPGWSLAVPKCVLDELEGLKGRRNAREARALALRFPAVPSAGGSGDAALLETALSGAGRAVLTNDRALRAALRKAGVTVLYVRGRDRIEVDGPL